MNTLIIAIMAAPISLLQYVGCINARGTPHACVRRTTQWPGSPEKRVFADYWHYWLNLPTLKLCVGAAGMKMKGEWRKEVVSLKQTVELCTIKTMMQGDG